MKVMFVNGSSHLHGTTMAAIEEMEKVFRAEGIETEVIQVGGKPIADCLHTRADVFSISWIAHFTAATAMKTSNSSPAQQSQSQEEAGRRLRWTR